MSLNTSLPFSRIRRAGGLVFLSGELPLNADGSIPEGISAQTELTLQRIGVTLADAGLTLADVVQVTVYLSHQEDFASFNEIYRRHFSAPFPTRTTVVAALVVPSARVELTVVAAEPTPS